MHTVLVVDDEKVIRDGCSRLLRLEEYQVLAAVNGREALDLLSTEPTDLVLCDLVMPVMGAFEVLEEIDKGRRLSLIFSPILYSEWLLPFPRC